MEALPEGYQEVFQAGARRSFFLSRDWFQNLAATTMSARDPVRVYGLETEAGAPVAALPMVCRPRERPLTSLARLESLANYYSCAFSPVLREGEDSARVADALAGGLWRDRSAWDTLVLQPLDRGTPIYAELVRALTEAGIVVQTYFCFGNWYLDVAGRSYQAYLEGLSSVLRKNIPYNTRRLEKSGRARITLITGESGLDEALRDYDTVYNASWKVPEPHPGFIGGLARTAARNGWLRLGLIYMDGAPAAAQLWIVHEGVASIYKIAYDEQYAKLSIGTVLTAKLMQHVIDVDRVTIVDYLSGDDDYKRTWMSHRREFWGILGFNPRSVGGVVQMARHVGGRFAKQLLHRLRWISSHRG